MTVHLAWRSLQADRSRLLASGAGVALSVVLILLLVGIYNGFVAGSTAYIDQAGADVWVAQEGSTDMYHSVSLLPASVGDRIAAVEGVASVTPLYGRAFHSHYLGVESDLYVLGYDTRTGIGGARDIAEGRAPAGGDDIVVTRVYARDVGAAIGDRIHLVDREWTIVGITDIPSVSVNSYAFVALESARASFQMDGLVNFYLLRAGADVSRDALAERVEREVTGVSAASTEVFAENNGKAIRELFVPILLAIAGIGFIIGLAVVSVTTYSAVNERITEFGVLKAIGADDTRLYRLVTAQAATASLIGVVAAVPLYLAASAALTAIVPRIDVVTRWQHAAVIALALVAMALAASVLPVRRIRRIDPADVFRGGWST